MRFHSIPCSRPCCALLISKLLCVILALLTFLLLLVNARHEAKNDLPAGAQPLAYADVSHRSIMGSHQSSQGLLTLAEAVAIGIRAVNDLSSNEAEQKGAQAKAIFQQQTVSRQVQGQRMIQSLHSKSNKTGLGNIGVMAGLAYTACRLDLTDRCYRLFHRTLSSLSLLMPSSFERSVVEGMAASVVFARDRSALTGDWKAINRHCEAGESCSVAMQGISEIEAQQRQDSQCRGTMGEFKRWRALGPQLRQYAMQAGASNSNAFQWPNFTRATGLFSGGEMTDLNEWLDAVRQGNEWKALLFQNQEGDSGPVDDLRYRANVLNLHMRWPGNKTQAFVSHRRLPLWLRVCRRQQPLDKVIDSINSLQHPELAELWVSVDCDRAYGVLEQVRRVQNMPVRVLFHSHRIDLKSLGVRVDGEAHHVHKINSHYLWGLYLFFRKLNLPYIVTLEDDLLLSPDFLEWHSSMMEHAINQPTVFAVQSTAHGPLHDCAQIKRQLRPLESECNVLKGALADKAPTLSKCSCTWRNPADGYFEDYFAGWGAGLLNANGRFSNAKAQIDWFELFSRVWNVSGIYDGVMMGLMDGQLTIAPCNPKVVVLPNEGVHGSADKRWDFWLPAYQMLERPLKRVVWDIAMQDGLAIPYEVFDSRLRHSKQWAKQLQTEGKRSRRRFDMPRVSVALWSTDLHIGPIADVKEVVSHFSKSRNLDVTVHDQSLSAHCKFVGTCADPIISEALPSAWAERADEKLAKRAAEVLKNHDGFQRSSAILCNHPVGLCSVYDQFKEKSLFAVSSTRFELGQNTTARWNGLIEKLRMWDHRRGSFVGANNAYDALYLRYFTGLEAKMIRSYSWVNAPFLPSQRQVLMSMPQNVYNALLPLLEGISANMAPAYGGDSVQFVHIRALYRKYTYDQLASHPFIVHVPYQVSTMSFTEQYRQGIPLFVPSLKLLSHWHKEHNIVSHRVWRTVFHGPDGDHSASSAQQMSQYMQPGMHPSAADSKDGFVLPDPNDEHDGTAVRFWLSLSDMYTLPGILQFESLEHLVHLALVTDPYEVSVRMQAHNLADRLQVMDMWEVLLRTAAEKRVLE